MFAHGRLKLQTRDQLQNLTENTAYSVHGGISVRWYWFSTINPTYRRFHLAALAAQSLTLGGSHLNWTRVASHRPDPASSSSPLVLLDEASRHKVFQDLGMPYSSLDATPQTSPSNPGVREQMLHDFLPLASSALRSC